MACPPVESSSLRKCLPPPRKTRRFTGDVRAVLVMCLCVFKDVKTTLVVFVCLRLKTLTHPYLCVCVQRS